MTETNRAPTHETGFNAALASFVIMGIVLLWSGAHDMVSGQFIGEPSAYDISKGILSVSLVPLSFICISKGQTVAGTVSLTVAMFSLTFLPGSFIMGTHAGGIGDIPFAVMLAVTAYTATLHGRRLFSANVCLLTLSVTMKAMDVSYLLGDALMILSGAVFLLMGLLGFVSLYSTPPAGIVGGTDDRFLVPGIAIMGIHGLLTAVSPNGPVLCIDSSVLSLMLLAVSLRILRDGRILTGTAMMMYGMCNIVGIIPSAMGMESLWTGSAVFCIPLAVCGVLLTRSNRLLGATLSSFAVVAVISAALGSEAVHDVAYAVAGIGMTVTTLLMLAGRMTVADSAKVIPELTSASQVPTTGGFVLSCMMILASVTGEYVISSEIADDSVADAMIMVSALMTMVMSVVAIRSRMITESLVFLLTGTSMMIMTVAEMTFMTEGLVLVSSFMTVGLFTSAFIFLRRGDTCRCAATVAAAIGLVTIPMGLGHWAFVICLVSGILYMASAVKKSMVFGIFGNAKIVHRENLTQTDMEYSAVLTKTMGIFLIAMMTLMYGLNTVGRDQLEGMEVTRVIICTILMGFGTYAVSNGISTTGAFMFMTSAFGLTSSVMNVTGFQVLGCFQQLVALAFVPVFYTTFRSGDRVLFLISSLMFASFMLNPITGAGTLFTLMDMALKIVTCVSAIIVWVQYDTGRRFLDGILAGLSRKGRVRATVPREPLRTTGSMALMASALSCIWIGASMVSGDISDPDVLIPSTVLSLVTVLFSLCMMCRGMLTEGMCVMSVGVTILSVPLGHGSFDLPAMALLAYSSVLAVTEGRDRMAVMAAVCLLSRILMAFSEPAGGLTVMMLGIVLLPLAAAGLSGHMGSPSENGDRHDVAMVMAAAAGTSSVLLLMNPGSMMSGLVVSAVASCLAMTLVMRGYEPEGLYILSMCIPCIGYGILGLSDIVGESTPLMVMSLAIFVSGCAFLHRRNTFLSVSCMVCTVMFILFLVTDDTTVCSLGGIAFSVMTAAYVFMGRSGTGDVPIPS